MLLKVPIEMTQWVHKLATRIWHLTYWAGVCLCEKGYIPIKCRKNGLPWRGRGINGDCKMRTNSDKKPTKRKSFFDFEFEMTRTREIMLVIIVAMLIVISGLAFLVILPKPERPIAAELEIDEVYFVATDLGEGEYELEVFAFVSNEGEKKADVSIRAFAIDVSSNLALDQDSVVIGKVKGESTSEASLTMVLSADRRYRIELLLFKDGKVTIKGEGIVNLAPDGSGGSDYETKQGDSDAERPDEPPIYQWIRIIGILVIIIFWIAVAYRVVYDKRRC
jgi:hypothetical protein